MARDPDGERLDRWLPPGVGLDGRSGAVIPRKRVADEVANVQRVNITALGEPVGLGQDPRAEETAPASAFGRQSARGFSAEPLAEGIRDCRRRCPAQGSERRPLPQRLDLRYRPAQVIWALDIEHEGGSRRYYCNQLRTRVLQAPGPAEPSSGQPPSRGAWEGPGPLLREAPVGPADPKEDGENHLDRLAFRASLKGGKRQLTPRVSQLYNHVYRPQDHLAPGQGFGHRAERLGACGKGGAVQKR